MGAGGGGGFFNPCFVFLIFLYFYYHVEAKRLGLEKLGS